jgi:hypothetical protein
VRKLSIGKYKGKTPKSPDTPSSQEEYQSVSTEEDCVFTASPSLTVTDGRPILEGIAQTVSSPIDQWTADGKVNKSHPNISEGTCHGDSVPQVMSGGKDASLEAESTSQNETQNTAKGEGESKIDGEVTVPKLADHSDAQNMAETHENAFELDQSEDVSPADSSDNTAPVTRHCKPEVLSEISPSNTMPPAVGEDEVSKNETCLAEISEDGDRSPEQDPEDKKLTTKDHILSITTPMLMRHRREMEEYLKMLEPQPVSVDPYGVSLPDIMDDPDSFDLSVEEKAKSPGATKRTVGEVRFSRSLSSSVSSWGCSLQKCISSTCDREVVSVSPFACFISEITERISIKFSIRIFTKCFRANLIFG